MTLLYSDPVFLEHRTGDHPECPGRLLPLIRHLRFVGLDAQCRKPAWEAATLDQLSRVHTADYVDSVKAFAASGGGYLEQDTVLSERSYDVALQAAGASCDAVRRVVGGEDRRALCLVRPPGHHALESGAMGFCLFNNIAVAARSAIEELGLRRVLIVDWDVHHGNGTQDAFWDDGQVGFLSIHRYPFYPGTGAASETGSREGLGMTKNLPITFGTPRSEYLETFATEVETFVDHVRPELVLISAGFDAHRADPIGSLGLESEDFAALTRVVLDVAETHAAGRVVSILEGGYNPVAMTESVETHLQELLRE